MLGTAFAHINPPAAIIIHTAVLKCICKRLRLCGSVINLEPFTLNLEL